MNLLQSLLLRALILTLDIYPPVNSNWWYLSQFDTELQTDPSILCEVIPKGSKKQRQICRKYSDVVGSMVGGVKSAISECQQQFYFSRWNCTTFARDPSVFGKYFVRGGTRELAFVQAMIAASAIHAVAKDCASGKLACGCSLDPSVLPEEVPTKFSGTKFKWKGCEQGVIFSLKFFRRFIDRPQSRVRDTKAKTTLHNNRAGRQAFERQAPTLCKCHGLSGSCTIQTCWRTLPTIRSIGNGLKDEYEGAIRITADPAGSLIPVDQLQRKPNKQSLVYYDESPNYCLTNRSQGSMGTEGRQCHESSEGEDSCALLCCGRGWNSIQKSVTSHCECRFEWCCEVTCKKCQEIRVESHCY